MTLSSRYAILWVFEMTWLYLCCFHTAPALKVTAKEFYWHSISHEKKTEWYCYYVVKSSGSASLTSFHHCNTHGWMDKIATEYGIFLLTCQSVKTVLFVIVVRFVCVHVTSWVMLLVTLATKTFPANGQILFQSS